MSTPRCPPPRGRRAPRAGLDRPHGHGGRRQRENVRPQIHENYDGEAVTLPATGTVLDPKVFPFLREMKGQTLITTDGTTLLGADDKAGVAEILTAAEILLAEAAPMASSASPSPPTRRSARALPSLISRALVRISPTPLMAVTWAASSMRTSTQLPPP